MFLIHLKWRAGSFRLHQVFPILMVQMHFFPNSTGPWPRLQKGRKIPGFGLGDDPILHFVVKFHKGLF